MTEPETLPRSRPRIEGVREEEILAATVVLLLEVGYHRLTMDAVAKRAKASKATLYRRWESKPELVIDALVRVKGRAAEDAPDTGSLRGDLLAAYCGHDGVANPGTRAVMGAVITAISTDPAFGEMFRERFLAPKLAISRLIYQRAMDRGEIDAEADLELIAPALSGVLLHRSFLLGIEPSDAQVERVIDHLILPAATRGTDKPRRKKTA